ncbi:type IV pilin [Halorarius halobius]|uniref:type IV pilin n=1 Tax=Halorarius halobius TaxID=2962671 RepID=UPI0020CE7A6B|nr:type IV pilin N-terminal domain-containing protein [Halorarius halobius]
MQLKNLITDEDAVSPVIGVILMVAITVILAAVIGTFVLGLGDQVQSSAPNANFEFTYEQDTSPPGITITHTGGQDVDADNVIIQGASDDSDNADTNSYTGWSDSTISTGSAWDGSVDSSVDTVRVVWESPSGGTSNTIGESEVPS